MWNRVHQKLALLASLDREFQRPCAASHQYRLRGVATADEVAETEKRYGIRLPDEYREYVTNFANGGAGPFHGIYRLGHYQDLGDWHPWNEGTLAVSPGAPFLLTESWNLPAKFIFEHLNGTPSPDAERDAVDSLARIGRVLAEPRGQVAGRNPFTGGPILETWESVILNASCAPDLMDGSIPIATKGCNLGVSLVVSGPERGNIWYDLRADMEGITPASKPGSPRLTFLQWYEDWLDRALAAYNY